MQAVTFKSVIVSFISINLVLLLSQFSFARTENSHPKRKASLLKESPSPLIAKNPISLQKRVARKAKRYTFRLASFSKLEKIEIAVEIELENIVFKRGSFVKCLSFVGNQLIQNTQMLILNTDFAPSNLIHLLCKLYLLFQALKIP